MLAESNAVFSAIYEVILGLLQLYNEIVVLPPNKMPDEILELSKCDALLDCIGAIDGTHLPIIIKGGEDTQVPWRDKAQKLTQNIFVAVDFKLNFVYVLTGWEGSAYNQQVFNAAKNKREGAFKIPLGCYYAADAGYTNTAIILMLY